MTDVKTAGSSPVFIPTTNEVPTDQKEIQPSIQEKPAQVQQEQPLSKGEIYDRKSEVNSRGAARFSQLNAQIANNQSVSATSVQAQAIMDNKYLSVDRKKAELQKLMNGASRDEFSDLVSKSKDWPDSQKQVFNAALGESKDLMRRVAKEFPAEQQYETVLNVDKYAPAASRSKVTENIGEWAATTSDKIYNYGLDTNKEFKAKMTDIVKSSGENGGPHLSQDVREKIVDKLNGRNKQDFITDSVYPNLKGAGNNFGVASLHERLLKRMSPEEKNQLIDTLQNSGNLNYFLAFKTDARPLLDGLTPRNAGVVAAELSKMHAQQEYKIMLNQVNGYAENNFKGRDYDEYIRIRNNYIK
jgi:hypothetical protein